MKKTKTNFAADPNRAMQDIMETIDSLKGIYIRETEALGATDTKAFLEMQEAKLEAAKQYHVGIEELLSRKDALKTINPLLKNRLAAMQKEFSDLADKNLDALKRMQRCTERLGDAIMSAAKDAAKSQQNFAYGENGSLRGNEKKTVSMGVSETA